MKCPIDNTELVMSERQGIEIDYCPSCRGVWLDRGELDKIIERSVPAPQAQPSPAPIRQPEPQQQRYSDDRRDSGSRQRYHDDDDHDRRYPKKRRESFLSELFDF